MQKSRNFPITMSGLNIWLSLTIICQLSMAPSLNAQMKDTTKKFVINYPNIPKIEISQWLLYPSSFHVAYERVLNQNHSFELFGGYNLFPLSLDLNVTGVNLTSTNNHTGYSFGGEFRFYLNKENKYEAPHGVYLAPFFSYFDFGGNRTLTHTDSAGIGESASLVTRTTFLSFGGELGYQFVIFKHITIDCEFFGPSFTYYTFQAKINGELTGIDQNSLLAQVISDLKEKIPLLNDVANGATISKAGFTDARFPAIGFRYAINIGYRF